MSDAETLVVNVHVPQKVDLGEEAEAAEAAEGEEAEGEEAAEEAAAESAHVADAHVDAIWNSELLLLESIKVFFLSS